MARGPGLRVQLSPIKGVTQGRAAKLLKPQFRMQCAPLDQFQQTRGHNHVRGANYQGRETIHRSGRKLADIPLRTLIVEYAPWVTEQRWDLYGMRDVFIEISEEGWPFRLLATHKYGGGQPEFDGAVVLESVVITENAGEQDARYLDFQFTEYDDGKVTRSTNRRAGPAKDWPFTITLRKDGSYVASTPKSFKTRGEPLTLAVIAKYAYGQPSMAYFVGQSQRPKITDWGAHDPLINYSRFKGKGGKLTVEQQPNVAVHPGVANVGRTPSKGKGKH